MPCSKDLPWKPHINSRKSPNNLSVHGTKLRVERNQAKNGGKKVEEIELNALCETFRNITERLGVLRQKEVQEVLSPYELGLVSYLQRLLGAALTLLRGTRENGHKPNWRQLQALFKDWESREQGGYTHDENGRQAWAQSKKKIVDSPGHATASPISRSPSPATSRLGSDNAVSPDIACPDLDDARPAKAKKPALRLDRQLGYPSNNRWRNSRDENSTQQSSPTNTSEGEDDEMPVDSEMSENEGKEHGAEAEPEPLTGLNLGRSPSPCRDNGTSHNGCPSSDVGTSDEEKDEKETAVLLLQNEPKIPINLKQNVHHRPLSKSVCGTDSQDDKAKEEGDKSPLSAPQSLRTPFKPSLAASPERDIPVQEGESSVSIRRITTARRGKGTGPFTAPRGRPTLVAPTEEQIQAAHAPRQLRAEKRRHNNAVAGPSALDARSSSVARDRSPPLGSPSKKARTTEPNSESSGEKSSKRAPPKAKSLSVLVIGRHAYHIHKALAAARRSQKQSGNVAVKAEAVALATKLVEKVMKDSDICKEETKATFSKLPPGSAGAMKSIRLLSTAHQTLWEDMTTWCLGD